MSTIANLDWKRIGTDAAAGTAGLVLGGPGGASAGVLIAEAAQWRARGDSTADADATESPEE